MHDIDLFFSYDHHERERVRPWWKSRRNGWDSVVIGHGHQQRQRLVRSVGRHDSLPASVSTGINQSLMGLIRMLSNGMGISSPRWHL